MNEIIEFECILLCIIFIIIILYFCYKRDIREEKDIFEKNFDENKYKINSKEAKANYQSFKNTEKNDTLLKENILDINNENNIKTKNFEFELDEIVDFSDEKYIRSFDKKISLKEEFLKQIDSNLLNK